MAEVDNPPSSSGVVQHPRVHETQPGSGNGPRPRVVVCSDICLLREGIALAVARDSPFDVAATAEPEDSLAIAAAQCPDVILLDAGVVGGRELPRMLKEVCPDLRIVVFALTGSDADILEWAEAGAGGYVARNGGFGDVIMAVEGALRGEVFCSPKLAGLLFARVAKLSKEAAPDRAAGVLTPREQEIMSFVEQGLPNKEIARRLGIGHATVKNHVHRILEKLQARGRGEAAARARSMAQAKLGVMSGS